MILCVTPNIALDRTLIVPRFVGGDVHRASQTILAAGGKGFNVARAINLLGGSAQVSGLRGGLTGRLVMELAIAEGLNCHLLPVKMQTRTCTIIVSQDKQPATVINEEGGVNSAEWQQFIAQVAEASTHADIVAVSGSVPLGSAENAPADLIYAAKQQGKPVWVDTSKQALHHSIAAQPDGIKINQNELAILVGHELNSVAETQKAAQRLLLRGIKQIIITMGAKGALFVSADLALFASAPSIPIISAVGSGDSFFAAWLLAQVRQLPIELSLVQAIAAGTANAQNSTAANFSLTTYQQLIPLVQISTLPTNC